jgi:hypothetical protein
MPNQMFSCEQLDVHKLLPSFNHQIIRSHTVNLSILLVPTFLPFSIVGYLVTSPERPKDAAEHDRRCLCNISDHTRLIVVSEIFAIGRASNGRDLNPGWTLKAHHEGYTASSRTIILGINRFYSSKIFTESSYRETGLVEVGEQRRLRLQSRSPVDLRSKFKKTWIIIHLFICVDDIGQVDPRGRFPIHRERPNGD